MDHLPFLVNCASAVALVFLNRHLMADCGFAYVGLLGALHMGVTAAVAFAQTPTSVATRLTRFDVAYFAALSLASMVAQNLSLLVNHVGVYQLSKVAMIPACCVLEYLLQGTRLSRTRTAAVAVVIAGVCCATLSDVSPSWYGTLIAMVGVWSSAGHNVACSLFFKKYSINGSTLVRDTAPLQALLLLLVGPMLDKQLAGSFPWEWKHLQVPLEPHPCHALLLLSCALAAAVNLSLIACIRIYSATGSQVLGHSKTVAILLISWLDRKPNPNIVLWRQVLGAGIIFAGLIWYNHAMDIEKAAALAAAVAATGADEGGLEGLKDRLLQNGEATKAQNDEEV